MKNKKKKIQPIVYGTTLALALSLMMPSQSFAEESNRVSEDQVSQESKQATEDIPMIKVEVTDIKEKKKPEPVVVKNKEEGEDDYIVTHSSTGSKSNVATKDVL